MAPPKTANKRIKRPLRARKKAITRKTIRRKPLVRIRTAFGRKKGKKPVKQKSFSAPKRMPAISTRKIIAEMKTIPKWHIRISRFNPEMDFSPRTHEYEVAPKEGENILGLLTRIKHTQDGSLTFRASCENGGCGTCGVRVNGKPVLGCSTKVKDHLDVENGLRIDPLDEKNILKDLIVDEKHFFKQLNDVKPWIVSRRDDSKRNHKMGIHDVQALGNTPQCNLCGLCNTNADASAKPGLGPAAFVKGIRYANDIRDADVSRISALAKHLPVHYSLEKANLCPRNISPGDKIRTIQEKATKPTLPFPARIKKLSK